MVKLVETNYARHNYTNTIIKTIAGIPADRIHFDVLNIIQFLGRFDIFSREKCENLTSICSNVDSNKIRFIKFACEIYETESLQFLYDILDTIGQSDIVNTISRQDLRPIDRPELPHSKHLQTFYYWQKIIIDGNSVFDRDEYLRAKYNGISKTFNNHRKDSDKLVKASGMFAIVTWLRIQHCKRDTKRIREVLNGMLERWPKGVDDTLAMIFYNSKMAIAAIMDGDVKSAEEYNRNAKHLSASWQDPLTKALISHDSRYTNQRIFEYQGSEKHRKAIFKETIRGLCFLESDRNGCARFCQQLRRMLFLYIVQYKLNIHNDLDIQDTSHVTADDVRFASNAIKSFEGTLEVDKPVDPRRCMIYMVCKASVYERECQLSKAESLLTVATKLAGEGAHYENEAKNIKKFHDTLQLKVVKERETLLKLPSPNIITA